MATFASQEDVFEPLSQYDEQYTAPGDEVGRGASGVVRRATRRSDGLPVAVKTMDLRALRLAGGGGFSIARLRREVDVLRSLRHPAIVRLYGAYGDQDTVLLVMELVEGRELFDAILSRGKFDEVSARNIFSKLCQAVAYMHARNIIHRDVKPENVLVTGTNEDEVKLVDFGLSKLVAGSMVGASRAHTMVGTPSYLAPEIENMKTKTHSLDLDTISKEEDLDLSDGTGAYDNKVDAWSLGVTLYVMLVARFPVYDRDQDGTIVGARVPEDLSPDSRRLLLRLLAADPVQRLSATDALQDPWLLPSSELALTPPASPPEKKREASSEEESTDNPMGLAHAHAALVASSALGLPPELRSAGLDYHERAVASRALATKLRGTALLVLEMIDDLKAALDARNADAAREVLGAVRRWTSDLEKECALAKKGNLAAMRRLAQAVGEEAPSDEVKPTPETPAPRLKEATASMSLDDNQPETPDAPASQSANTPLDLKNDEVLELMLPVTADDLRPPPVSRTRPARNHLLRCLGELHVVFTRMELVWSKVEVSLDAVLKRSEALEVLLGFADTPALKGRLDVRLAKFKAFWAGLAEWDLDVAVPGIASSAAAGA